MALDGVQVYGGSIPIFVQKRVFQLAQKEFRDDFQFNWDLFRGWIPVCLDVESLGSPGVVIRLPGKDRLDVDVPGESVADKRVKAGFADSLPSAEAVVKAKVKQACKVSRRGQVNAEVVAKRVGRTVKERESKCGRECKRHTVVEAVAVVRNKAKLAGNLVSEFPNKES